MDKTFRLDIINSINLDSELVLDFDKENDLF